MKNIFLFLCFCISISFSACSQETGLKQDLALKYLVQMPPVKNTKPPLLILLHGYGSDEANLFDLCKFLPKDFLIVSARAPYSLPRGGYQWYEMTQESGHHSGKKETLDNSRNLILKFISQLISKYNIDSKQVYLSGFSQGAMMSYMVGLSNPDKLKGIAPLSGMIIGSVKPEIKNNSALKQMKIFIAHGTADERILFSEDTDSYNYLMTLGLKPEFHKYDGVEHQITKEELDDLAKWLKK